MAEGELGNLYVSIGAKLDDLKKGLDEVKVKVSDAGKGAQESGQHFSSFGQIQNDLVGKLAATVGAIALLAKGYSELKSIVSTAISGAIEEENAERRLSASLEISGRTLAGNKEHYMAFAMEQHRATLFTHEQVEESQALLLQMTHLNQDGIDKSIKGAIGLSTVFGKDLHASTLMITKAMEGNYTALKRYGIAIDDTLGPEEKQAQLLEKLGVLYARAQSETGTFAGQVGQLKKAWGESLETLGQAVVKNDDLKKIIGDVRAALDDFVKDGTAAKWAEAIAKALHGIITDFEMLKGIMGGIPGLGAGMFDSLFGKGEEVEGKIKRNTQAARDFRDSLTTFHPTMAQLSDEMIKGEANWATYTARLKAADDEFRRGKEPIVAWMASLIGAKTGINETGGAAEAASAKLKKMMDEMRTNISSSGASDYQKQINEAKKALSERLAAIDTEKTATKAAKEAQGLAYAEYAAKVKEIEKNKAEDLKKIQTDSDMAIAKSGRDKFENDRRLADLEYQTAVDAAKKKFGASTEFDAAQMAAAEEWAAKVDAIDEAEADHKVALMKKIAEARKKHDDDAAASYKDNVKIQREADEAMASLDLYGVQAQIQNIKKESAAKTESILLDRKTTLAHKLWLLFEWGDYYKQLEKLVKKDALVHTMQAVWSGISQVISAALSNLSSSMSTYYSNEIKKSDDYFDAQIKGADEAKTQQLTDLDAWYQAQKKTITDNVKDKTEQADQLAALDADYAAKKAEIEKNADITRQGLEAAKAARADALKREEFEKQKKIDVATALMGVASAIISALSTKPFIPLGLIAAATAAALGAVQVGAISSRQFPLAGGAVFTQPTAFSMPSGQSYVAGEAGVEFMNTEKMLRNVVRSEVSAAGGGKGGGVIARLVNKVILDKKVLAEQVLDIVDVGVKTRQLKLVEAR